VTNTKYVQVWVCLRGKARNITSTYAIQSHGQIVRSPG
jgi:hypothetical protein